MTKLQAIRQRAIDAGMQLKTEDEILQEQTMSDEEKSETCERCGIGSDEALCDDCERADNPNAEALRIVRECLTPEARAALAHLLNNALAPVVMEADMLRPTGSSEPRRIPGIRYFRTSPESTGYAASENVDALCLAVAHLRTVVAEVLR